MRMFGEPPKIDNPKKIPRWQMSLLRFSIVSPPYLLAVAVVILVALWMAGVR